MSNPLCYHSSELLITKAIASYQIVQICTLQIRLYIASLRVRYLLVLRVEEHFLTVTRNSAPAIFMSTRSSQRTIHHLWILFGMVPLLLCWFDWSAKKEELVLSLMPLTLIIFVIRHVFEMIHCYSSYLIQLRLYNYNNYGYSAWHDTGIKLWAWHGLRVCTAWACRLRFSTPLCQAFSACLYATILEGYK